MKRYLCRKFAATLLVLIILPAILSSCGKNSPRRYSTDILGSFDTVISIIAYCENDADFTRLKEYTADRFYQLHQLFDLYNSYAGVNNVNTINEMAGRASVTVDQELIDLIETTRGWYHNSPQVTNIAMGSVLRIWHDYRSQGIANPELAELPSTAELLRAAKHTDFGLIQVDKSAKTVFIPDENMRLDLGAVAKGYATEIITSELIDMGYSSFIISSGGNIRAVGQPQDENRTMWGIGIQDPQGGENSNGLLDTVYVNDMSVVTSGDYQRYYVVDGIKYHHIIDPSTLFPGDYHQAVTVAIQDSGLADFLSTTLFLMPYESGREYIESIPGAEALWVLQNGEVKTTAGMLAMLKNRGNAQNPPPEP